MDWFERLTGFRETAYADTRRRLKIEGGQRGASNVVLLTRLGGGAFGNDNEWIHDAMLRALRTVEGFVKLVSYGEPSHATSQMV